MQLLLPAAVFVLMVSVGMSLRFGQVVAKWRGHSWSTWIRLLLANFIIPAAAALLLARIFPLTLRQTGGLFMVGATPGAPLLTRNLARRGFDMHLAASYQVWGAVLTPVMIPLMTFAAGKLYDRSIWIPPRILAWQIVEKEFLPVLVGMALVHFAPAFSGKAQQAVNMIGNGVLHPGLRRDVVEDGSATEGGYALDRAGRGASADHVDRRDAPVDQRRRRDEAHLRGE